MEKSWVWTNDKKKMSGGDMSSTPSTTYRKWREQKYMRMKKENLTLPLSYIQIPDLTRIPLLEKDLGSSRGRSAIDGCCLRWGKMFKRRIIHDVPRVTANSTVVVGAYNVCMSSVTTEVTLDCEAIMLGLGKDKCRPCKVKGIRNKGSR